jgi:hypothetical protein
MPVGFMYIVIVVSVMLTCDNFGRWSPTNQLFLAHLAAEDDVSKTSILVLFMLFLLVLFMLFLPVKLLFSQIVSCLFCLWVGIITHIQQLQVAETWALFTTSCQLCHVLVCRYRNSTIVMCHINKVALIHRQKQQTNLWNMIFNFFCWKWCYQTRSEI